MYRYSRFTVYYASGTRAQEVCDLTVGDIQFYPDRAGINIHGKGQKVRRIGIPCDASNMLKKYIEHRRIINMLEAGFPLIVVKNFLGHVSLQTTKIYTEITQDTMNKQLKSWNDKWFLKDNSHFENTNGKSNIPEFLR
ncbi:Tyrosine recombinase XerC [Eubacterium plexicaudatum ASF492]|uniref:Tyr recombinase domain-containing protein n=1 Tax=Eubacterium plexicaudatum ASF492 TaxID=1235802 RepID=N2ARC9_9FIRM|nr:Tyrosine recombinase XerC [Eubacterium plexicaudatum ASF492]